MFGFSLTSSAASKCSLRLITADFTNGFLEAAALFLIILGEILLRLMKAPNDG
ncbi:hypothetical protein [Methylorubrum aminovorans]